MESTSKTRLVKILDLALNDGSSFQPPLAGSIKFIAQLEEECFELFSKDFNCQFLNNSQGQLCSTYPSRIIIPLSQKVGFTFNDPGGGKETKESIVDVAKLNDLIGKCRYARTRCRFPIPSIIVDGKFVCRSSTLARSPEIYARLVGSSWYNYFVQGDSTQTRNDEEDKEISLHKSTQSLTSDLEQELSNSCLESTVPNGSSSMSHLAGVCETDLNCEYNDQKGKEWQVDKTRNLDVNLLNLLKVDVICDFMVENKKVKYGLNVTSSEKVDTQQRYNQFQLLSVPYPGCEFFAEYQKSNYKGEGLKFDWKQTFVDAQLNIPTEINNMLKIPWTDYVDWDLVKLTQNYLLLLLDSLSKPVSSGILLHCISGWDRTPLFVSILRLSLWADGLIHESLNAEDIVFLTVAYDWLLFSHQFSDRIEKGEEIMYFCFDFLSYITANEFSLVKLAHVKQKPAEENELSESIFILDSYYPTQSINGFNGHEMVNDFENFSLNRNSRIEDLSDDRSAINGLDSSDEDSQSNQESDTSAAILFVKDNCLENSDQCENKSIQNDSLKENSPTSTIKPPLGNSNSAPASPKSKIDICEKSRPIPIKSRLRSGSLDCSHGSASDCDNTSTAPGSWQMVTLNGNFPNSSSHESDDKTTSDIKGATKTNGSFKTTSFTNGNEENGEEKKTTCYEELYERRKQRLLDAQRVFYPAYKQSLEELATRQQQSGAISNLINHFRSKLTA